MNGKREQKSRDELSIDVLALMHQYYRTDWFFLGWNSFQIQRNASHERNHNPQVPQLFSAGLCVVLLVLLMNYILLGFVFLPSFDFKIFKPTF